MKPTKLTTKHTLAASYLGYVTQAIVNNFAPLLFITFQNTFQIPLTQIALLVSFNFGVQLLVDLISPRFVRRFGYRRCIVAAHLLAAVGLAGLGLFPRLFPIPFFGLLCAVFLYAIGGGLIEVMISPIVEACPLDKKSAAMSLLHSFYCWGHVLVVLVSTAFFALAGVSCWPLMAMLWAILPLCTAVLFLRVPIYTLEGDEGERPTIRQLSGQRLFFVLLLLMLCAGASEQAMSQWASAFAEAGLQVSKTIGDLAGPCMFAVLMGSARVFYAKKSETIDLRRFMCGSGLLCVCAYLLAAFAPWPLLSLLGCALCGFSVGVLWPGTFSIAAAECKQGGTLMFALLALAGDFGCALGPAVVGAVSERFSDSLRAGLLAAVVFPCLLLFGLRLVRKQKRA